MDMPDIDPNFEPQTRVRSNTWPVRPRELDIDSEGARTPNSVNSEVDIERHEVDTIPEVGDEKGDQSSVNQKKGGSRRNAWGNLSYADLITKAIQGSPEQRLTLSQIYDWMVQNVPYFRDKGDSNSSAGWKNSIRHNLSLHSRFMRVQNEGTGKSSWWVLNPDAKPGKTPRRRATSMDTKVYEKKKGRVKRKVEQLRAAMEGQALNDTGSYNGSELSLQDAFNISATDQFRERACSNASSLGGRLSPIQYEDLCDSMSPLPFTAGYSGGNEGYTDITESLAGMLVGDGSLLSQEVQDSLVSSSSPIHQQVSPNYQDQNYLQVGGFGGRQASPQISPQTMLGGLNNIRCGNNMKLPSTNSNGYNQVPSMNQSVNMSSAMRQQPRPNYVPPQSLTELLEQDIVDEDMDDQSIGQPANSYINSQQPNNMGQFQPNSQQQQQMSQGVAFSNLTPQQRNLLTTSLLRQVLCNSDATQQLTNKLLAATNGAPNNHQNMVGASGGNKPQYMNPQQNGMTNVNQGQLSGNIGPNNDYQNMAGLSGGSLLTTQVSQDCDMGLGDIKPSDFSGCPDVDQMIKHELSFDDTLDFAFADQLQQVSTNNNVRL